MTTAAVTKDAAKAAPKTFGLSSSEAALRLQRDGPNAMPNTSAHPLRNAFTKVLGAGPLAGATSLTGGGRRAAFAFALFLDGIKIPIFARLQIS